MIKEKIKLLIFPLLFVVSINCGGPPIDIPTDAYLLDTEITIPTIKKDYCGDNICNPAWEDYLLCAQDCLPFCGDHICSSNWGETILNCYKDCKPKLTLGGFPKNPGEQIIDPPGD